jgi:SAM-dependent methyltransferase
VAAPTLWPELCGEFQLVGRWDVIAVTGFNSFQYAANPVAAVAEAGRVTRPGGRVVVAVWGTPEETEASAYIRALGSQMPAPPPGTPGPFALSADGALAALVEGAGLQAVVTDSVSCPWEYPDEETALRGLLSAGPAIRAIDHAGEGTVRRAVLDAIMPYRQPSGSYVMQNRFRLVIAEVLRSHSLISMDFP